MRRYRADTTNVIAVVITCHNRRTTTLECLRALYGARLPDPFEIQVYLVDDGSSDGTSDAVRTQYPAVAIIQGTGNLYWSRGMRRAYAAAMEKGHPFYLWLNDDTVLDPDAIVRLISTHSLLTARARGRSIVVGSTRDGDTGELSYGGVVRRSWWHPLRLRLVAPADTPRRCDTFFGNCVLVPSPVAEELGNLDPVFTHSGGDADYGFRARRMGVEIWVAPGYVGTCSRNPLEGTWEDPTLPIAVRWRMVRAPKGLPPGEWKVILQRQAPVLWPLYLTLPYARLVGGSVLARIRGVLDSSRWRAGHDMRVEDPADVRHPHVSHLGMEAVTTRSTRPRGLAVAVLTNFLPPHQLPLMQALWERFPDLHVYLSTPMEPNRQWAPSWGELPVTVQRSLAVNRRWKHPDGFVEDNYLHIPYDTLLLLHKQKPDVVLSTELGVRTAQSALYAKLNRKRLLLWATVSESTEKGRSAARRWVRKGLLRLSDGVVVNGESGRRYIRSLCPGARIYEIPRPIDYPSFAHITIMRAEGDRHTLLYVGRLSHGKGILPFLEVLGDLALEHPTRDLRMRIVGHGPLTDTLRSLRLPSNLTLELEAAVPYTEIPRVYAEAGALVLPTLADEWGMVVSEALASGLPVLGSTASQAVTELVRDDATGWTFDPLDRDAMKRVTQSFLETPPERLEEMGRRGRERVRRSDTDRVAARFAQVIQEPWPLGASAAPGRAAAAKTGRTEPS